MTQGTPRYTAEAKDCEDCVAADKESDEAEINGEGHMQKRKQERESRCNSR